MWYFLGNSSTVFSVECQIVQKISFITTFYVDCLYSRASLQHNIEISLKSSNKLSIFIVVPPKSSNKVSFYCLFFFNFVECKSFFFRNFNKLKTFILSFLHNSKKIRQNKQQWQCSAISVKALEYTRQLYYFHKNQLCKCKCISLIYLSA